MITYTLNQTFTAGLNDPSSQEWRRLEEEVCNQVSKVYSRYIFIERLTKDSHYLACEGEVWGAICACQVRANFHHCNRCTMRTIVLFMAAIYREYVVMILTNSHNIMGMTITVTHVLNVFFSDFSDNMSMLSFAWYYNCYVIMNIVSGIFLSSLLYSRTRSRVDMTIPIPTAHLIPCVHVLGPPLLTWFNLNPSMDK